MFHLPKSFFRAMLLALCTVTTPALATTVVEFYNTNLDNYFITADANEAAAIDGGGAGPGWIRTGDTFDSGGSTSVCRFYGSQSPGPNSHFYTVDADECAGLKQQQAITPATEKRWNFEGIAFDSTPPTNGTCSAGTVPVYRAYNNGSSRGIDSNHRITTNLTAIQEVVSRGWNNEGVVMCAPTTQTRVIVTTINDPTVPVIAVVADQYWKERITLIGNKNATGTPTSLTEIHYSTLGRDLKIELGPDGLPTVMSDPAGNNVVFTNWTASTVDITFFDQEGGKNVGPTTIPMDSAKLAALKKSYVILSQRRVTAGQHQAITKDEAKSWLPFAGYVFDAAVCTWGIATALPTWGASLVVSAGGCIKTVALLNIELNHPLAVVNQTIDIAQTVNDATNPAAWVELVVSKALENSPIIIDTFSTPGKPTWSAGGIFPHHHSIRLSWKGTEGDTDIKDYRITRGDKTTYTSFSGDYVDFNVIPGLHYCYQVQAVNSAYRASEASDPRCATVPVAAPPLVVTGKATNITPFSVTLNGSVNPEGTGTNAMFEYGTSTSYGNDTQLRGTGKGTSSINLTENLNNLAPNTIYHYRVVAINSESSVTFGSDQTFQSVVPVTAAPTISNVTPVTGSGSAQPLTLNGSHFVTGANITLRNKSTGEVFPNRQPTSFTNTSITLSIAFPTTAGTWSVNVINPDNSSTGEYVFSVVAPTGGSLSFTSLSPGSVDANAIGYLPTLTASGSNFNYVKQISFDWSGVVSGNSTWIKDDINWLRKVTINSDGSMALKPAVTQTGDPAGITNWTVTLRDSSGAAKSQSFTVNYQPTVTTTPPPTCTSSQVLTNGVCVTPPTVCTAPKTLVNGQCVTPTPTCTLPQVLTNGVCVTPPTVCTAPKTLVNGQCVTPTPTCTLPQVLQNGVCVTPAPTCTSTQVLTNGVCVTPTVAIPATPSSPTPGSTSSPGPTQSSSTVGLSWGAVSGATYYDLGVVDVASGALTVNTSPSSPGYTASLIAGKQYRWNVRACNTAGCSSYTGLRYFETPAAAVAINVSGLTAIQSGAGQAINGSFSVGGTSVSMVRVHAGSSQGGAYACYTDLAASAGSKSFSFNGDWINENGSCAALLPGAGSTGTIYFKVEARDSATPTGNLANAGTPPVTSASYTAAATVVATTVSGLTAIQSGDDQPIIGSFSVSGSSVSMVRVHAGSSSGGTYACYTDLAASTGSKSFSFNGNWTVENGQSCAALLPSPGHFSSIYFKVEARDSATPTGNLANAGTAPTYQTYYTVAAATVATSVSGLTASQSSAGQAITGSFSVSGSSVSMVRVHAGSSSGGTYACFTDLTASTGSKSFSFNGSWTVENGQSCTGLLPGAGSTSTIYFKVEARDSATPTGNLANAGTPPITSASYYTVPAATGYVSQGGLSWMPASSTYYTYAQATALCAGTINGQTGWRLPTLTELSGVTTPPTSYAYATGGLYGSGAMNGQGWTLGYTWSSTPISAGGHYDVGLDNGYVNWFGASTYNYVTCVR